MTDYVMYIFVNSELGLDRGQIAAQVGHVVHRIVDELVRCEYETYPPSVACFNYKKWNMNCTKVIMKSTEAQMRELLKMEESREFVDDVVIRHCTKYGCLTVVGFFPNTRDSPIGIVAQNYTLL